MCFNTKIPAQPPAPEPPAPTYTADDGTIFNDLGQFNAHQSSLRGSAFQTGLASAISGAETSGRNAISARGLNEADFFPLIQSEIGRIQGGVPDLHSNPGQFFSPTLGADVLNREESSRRAGFERDVNNIFTPNFARDAIPDTLDDAIMASILGEQRGEGEQFIQRATARGTLNPAGQAEANRILGTQSDQATARLGQVGTDVLTGFRGDINDIIGEARGGANTFRLGGQFSVDPFLNRANESIARSTADVGGAVRTGLGNDPLFDLDRLISKAGQFQGATNSGGGLLDALETRRKVKQQDRGLGSTGAF